MAMKKAVWAVVAAVAVAGGGLALAQVHDQHDHGKKEPAAKAQSAAQEHDHGAGQGAPKLALNNGKKWQTDAALRSGMTAIRSDVQAAVKPIHTGKYSDAQYTELATKIEKQVGSIMANCKLPPDADAQLHLILSDVFAGTKAMKSGEDRMGGVVKVIGALDSYGKYFDHAGWKGVAH